MKTKSLKDNEIYREQIIEEMQKVFTLDKRILREICYYPCKFAKRKMEDLNENRPIRIRYFCVFTQKNTYNKDKYIMLRSKTLLDNIEQVTLAMVILLAYELPNYDSTRRVINLAIETKDYEKIQDIYNAWKEYIK